MRLQLPAPTFKKIGSRAALKGAAPGGSGSATLVGSYFFKMVFDGSGSVSFEKVLLVWIRFQGIDRDPARIHNTAGVERNQIVFSVGPTTYLDV